MGKLKPTKKAHSPLKISTSLFQKRGRQSEESSDSSTPVSSPSPRKIMKVAKSAKAGVKAKVVVKGSRVTKATAAKPTSPKTKVVKKLEKAESPSKKKVGTKVKGKVEVKGKASPVKAGVKAKAEPKSKLKKPAVALKGKKKEVKEKAGPSPKVKKEKSPPPKSRTSNARGRSRSSDSVDSSSSSSSSSSSRSPSPSSRAKATKSKVLPKTKKPVVKKKSPGGSPGKKGLVAKVVKGAKGVKPKLNIVKKTAIVKAKGKQTKPKAKLKRMASLNAKAILEASFSFDAADKKKSPASTPTKLGPVKGGLSTDSDTIDLKPLTLLFSTVSETGFPLPSSKSSLTQQQKVGERKRKSSSTSMLKPSESPGSASASNSRRESEASNGATSAQATPTTGNSRSDSLSSGSESSALLRKGEKAKSRSPGPKKKTKVTSSSVSTSTSPFDPSEEPVSSLYHHQLDQHQDNRHRVMGSSAMIDRRGVQAQFSVQVQNAPHHPGDLTNHHHSTSTSSGTTSGSGKGQKSSQIKEKNSKSSSSATPVAHFGSTVYQPAGPLIEPHKVHNTGMVPAGILPDSVRIPSDLKVTYQTRPPTTCVLTVSTTASSQSSKACGASKGADGGRHKNSSSSTTTSAASNSRSSSKQILHQPYKSSTTSTAPTTTASSSSRSLPQTPSLQSSFTSPQSASFMSTVGSLTSPLGSTVTLSHQQGQGPLPSHLHPSSSILAAASSAGTSNPIPGAGIYYGYGGPHQSPFAPSKYPIVAPDTYRTHSPYPSPFLYAPTTPQPPGNYFMASTPSFYASTMTPNPGPAGLGAGATQARPLFAAHQHPSLSSITGAPYYQPGPPPPSAHPASNYYVAAPPIPPSHHSMQPSTAPGRAGNIQASSSRPACPFPTESSRMNNNSISNSSNSTSSNNSKANKLLLPKRLPLQPATSVTPRVASAPVGAKPNTAATKNSRRKECSTPALATDPPKSFIKHNNSGSSTVIDLVKSQAKQLESAKTFTEQYSLPDDITITPIIMSPSDAKSLTFTAYGLSPTKPVAGVVKKRDIVHVIDPRSGEKTTIAKHISNSNINKKASPPRNVSSVKPNNAGNVGKISPALDVIVLGPGKTHMQSNRNSLPSPRSRTTPNYQRAALASSPVANNDNNKRQLSEFKGQIQPSTKSTLSTPNTNMVQPLQLTKNENKTIKRKGLSLHECIDGLQRKKMRILADTNISITNVTGPNNNNLNQFLSQGQGLTIVPSNTTTSSVAGATQKSSRKHSKPRQRQSRNPALQSPPRSGPVNKRTISTESDLGAKIIDSNAAVAAVRALVVPQAQSKLPTISSPPMQAYSLSTPGMRKRVSDKRKPLKIKISRVEGKITTRSTTQNTKGLRTRAKKATPKSKAGEKATGRGKGRLLRDGARSDSSHGCSPSPNFPYFNSGASKEKAGKGGGAGNGSSTLTTVNNHVILRIPKNSERPKSLGGELTAGYGRNSYSLSPSTSGNMTMNALKKRAIVKPLSPSLVNGALHSLAMSSKKLPIHTHPRWSNGWRFEGSAFEAKVYIKNDDNPVLRRCYPAMRHDGGDVIHPRDCVLLKSGPKKTDLPFVAKVAAVWENPLDGEMMFSLLWYYRPEHTEIGRNNSDMPDEIFASKHRDSNSVATIEDKCYVLTFNEYCRYKKRLKQLQEGVSGYLPLVPLSTNSSITNVAVTNYANNLASAVWSGMASNISALTDPSTQSTAQLVPPPPSTGGKVSPEAVFFCRKVYDYRQKRMLKNPS